MPQEPVKYIGDKLVVGAIDYSFLPAVPSIPGTAVLNGPCWIGAGGPPAIPVANCMIGPSIASPVSLQILGIANHYGIYNRFAVTSVTGLTTKIGTTLRAALSGTTGVNIKSALNVGSALNTFLTVTVDTTCTAATFIGNITTTTGLNPEMVAVKVLAASKKSFDIPHPTKQDHRLRHICLEGPSADIFVRGRLKDSNIIKLPDYWKDLVDEESITVELQPIGSRHYHLNVEKFNNKEIHIKESDDKPIDCFYHVYGERKDTTKNIPEYRGLTPADYPGDNIEYTINDNK